jgi:hypothetical protein
MLFEVQTHDPSVLAIAALAAGGPGVIGIAR